MSGCVVNSSDTLAVFVHLLTYSQMLQEDDAIDHVGEIFVLQGDMFKFYAVYCSNQPNIRPRVSCLREENPAFERFVKVR